MSSKQKLSEAQVLANFANLEEKDVVAFRNGNLGFVPTAWWRHQFKHRERLHWLTNQEWLRDAWKKGFDIDFRALVELVTSVFDPQYVSTEYKYPGVVQAPDGRWLRVVDFAECASITEIEEFCPYHRAVLFLNEEKWRAKFCEECGKHFVAAHTRNDFCSVECFNENRRKQKLAAWHKHKKVWRKRRS